MSTNRAVTCCMLSLGVAIIVACAGGDKPADSAAGDTTNNAAQAMAKRASISMPAEGDSVSGDSVHVMMGVEGVRIVPVANATSAVVPGEGHLHLFLDRDVTPANVAIPMDSTAIHLGNGATEYMFRKVPKGPHRIIVVFAFTDHTPDMSVAMDTVNFVVR